MNNLSFIQVWITNLNGYFLQGIIPKELIVNVKDLEAYENELAKLYPIGGRLRFKNVPLSISDQLEPGECRIIE